MIAKILRVIIPLAMASVGIYLLLHAGWQVAAGAWLLVVAYTFGKKG